MDYHAKRQLNIRVSTKLGARWDGFSEKFGSKEAALRHLLDLAEAENEQPRAKEVASPKITQSKDGLYPMPRGAVQEYLSYGLTKQMKWDDKYGIVEKNGVHHWNRQ